MVKISCVERDGRHTNLRATAAPREGVVGKLESVCNESSLNWEEKNLLLRRLSSGWGMATPAPTGSDRLKTSAASRRRLARAKKLDAKLNERRKSKSQPTNAPSWSVGSWLSSLQLLVSLSAALLDQAGDSGEDEESEVIRRLNRRQISLAVDEAAAEMKERLYEEVEKLQTGSEVVDASKLNAKFAASKDGFTFTYGGMVSGKNHTPSYKNSRLLL